MKKILLLFMGIISILLISINASATTWQFIWSNTSVKIPVGSSLYDYYQVPYATLYKDGNKLEDAFITYNRNGDWLYYLKDVNTQKTGEYQVWYKAYEYDKYRPGTCNGYKALITFVVYDNIPPTITVVSNQLDIEKMSISEDELDEYLLTNVRISDNYSKDLNISINHNVDITTNGIYDVTVVASDDSGNTSYKSFKVNVFYNQYPSLTCINSDNQIYVEINKNIDLKEYFYASDKIDGDLVDSIKYNPFDTSSVKSFDLDVSVTNSSGYKTTITVRINVIDDVAPQIILKYDSINLDYQTNLDEYDFTFYVDIEDDALINYDNLTIKTNLENRVGVYDVIYSYTDGYNTVKKTMNVRMLSYTAPQIIIEDIKFKKNSNIDLNNYICVYDESDPLAKENLVIDDSEVIYTQNGTYYATAVCYNSSGLETKKTFRVIVEDDIINSSSLPFIIILIIVFSLILVAGIVFLVFILLKKKKRKLIQNP